MDIRYVERPAPLFIAEDPPCTIEWIEGPHIIDDLENLVAELFAQIIRRETS